MIIGFTGHQKIDDPDRWAWVREQFARIVREVAGRKDCVMVALAEGGDQLFAETALAADVPFEVIVPCEGYETSFDNPMARAHYQELLGRAVGVTKLGFPVPSEDAYLAAGMYIVEQAALVVALWNGQPAVGKGGTGDIVAYARLKGRPVIHINPNLKQVLRSDYYDEKED